MLFGYRLRVTVKPIRTTEQIVLVAIANAIVGQTVSDARFRDSRNPRTRRCAGEQAAYEEEVRPIR
jgi:hypothetical protein